MQPTISESIVSFDPAARLRLKNIQKPLGIILPFLWLKITNTWNLFWFCFLGINSCWILGTAEGGHRIEFWHVPKSLRVTSNMIPSCNLTVCYGKLHIDRFTHFQWYFFHGKLCESPEGDISFIRSHAGSVRGHPGVTSFGWVNVTNE